MNWLLRKSFTHIHTHTPYKQPAPNGMLSLSLFCNFFPHRYFFPPGSFSLDRYSLTNFLSLLVLRKLLSHSRKEGEIHSIVKEKVFCCCKHFRKIPHWVGFIYRRRRYYQTRGIFLTLSLTARMDENFCGG